VKRGEIVATSGGGTHFRAVLHAVAVDGMYQTSAAVIEEVVDAALRKTSSLVSRGILAPDSAGARVVLTALGTGFGRLSMREFGRGLKGVVGREYPGLEGVVLCVRKEGEVGEVIQGMKERAAGGQIVVD
jgi:hypothetical protein